MEDSLNSSMKQDLSSTAGPDSPEESGWTVYFEDFLSSKKEHISCSSGFESSSLVSDAASCAAWKFSDQGHVVGYPSVVGSEKSCNLKKKKSRGVLDDDSLEDTASSPVNSPKVSYMKKFGMNPRNKDDNLDNSEKGSTSGYCSELQKDERNELDFTGIERENDSTELKKRGLCLVPLSMFVNYLG